MNKVYVLTMSADVVYGPGDSRAEDILVKNERGVLWDGPHHPAFLDADEAETYRQSVDHYNFYTVTELDLRSGVSEKDQIQVSHAVGILFYSPYPYDWTSLFGPYGDLEGETIDWTR
jgi:hypothetical protein